MTEKANRFMEEKLEKLKKITEKMEKLAKNEGDTEVDHGVADDLLCEALTEIAQGTVLAARVMAITEAYSEVNKWYS